MKHGVHTASSAPAALVLVHPSGRHGSMSCHVFPAGSFAVEKASRLQAIMLPQPTNWRSVTHVCDGSFGCVRTGAASMAKQPGVLPQRSPSFAQSGPLLLQPASSVNETAT